MLGNTLATATSSGPLGTLTDNVGDKVLVPVVSLAESTTGKVGSSTGLGAPVKDLLNGVAQTADNTGNNVTDSGNGNPVTDLLGNALSNTSGAVGTPAAM